MLSTSSFSGVYRSVIGMLRQAIVDRVVIRGIRDEYVSVGFEAGGQVERTGHDADGRSVCEAPEQTRPATLAKASLCLFRRLKPAKSIIVRDLHISALAGRRCEIVTAGLSALRTVAIKHITQWARNFVCDAATQARATCFSRLLR